MEVDRCSQSDGGWVAGECVSGIAGGCDDDEAVGLGEQAGDYEAAFGGRVGPSFSVAERHVDVVGAGGGYAREGDPRGRTGAVDAYPLDTAE
jgi:hypothetical protein